jgi:hypothetical protein
MKTTKMTAGLALGMSLLGAAGCATHDDDGKPDQSDVKGGVDGKAEAWGSADNPALFNDGLEYRVAELPMTGEAQNIPWAGSYWPVYEDSINRKWAGASSEAPSTKYGRAFGVTGVEEGCRRFQPSSSPFFFRIWKASANDRAAMLRIRSIAIAENKVMTLLRSNA